LASLNTHIVTSNVLAYSTRTPAPSLTQAISSMRFKDWVNFATYFTASVAKQESYILHHPMETLGHALEGFANGIIDLPKNAYDYLMYLNYVNHGREDNLFMPGAIRHIQARDSFYAAKDRAAFLRRTNPKYASSQLGSGLTEFIAETGIMSFAGGIMKAGARNGEVDAATFVYHKGPRDMSPTGSVVRNSNGLNVAELIAKIRRRGGLISGVEDSAQAAIRSRVLVNIVETRSGINASNFGVHAAIEKVPFLDVSTGLDETTFWSGRGNRAVAESFAVPANKFTLEMTPGGKYLDSLNLFDRFPGKQAIIPWERLSLRFAQGASGRVSAFVEGARSEGVFYRIEYPALISNPEVTEVLFSPQYEQTNGFTP
ncbi:MAG: hypothetical protein KDC47_07545, partial [Flavobacteriaceae bacterium]|nr:hypothetical protein [Flavobacteriaceae bacterium]